MHIRPGVSAIVPAFNEERTILSVLRQIEWHPLIHEVIVVSDGSTDRTVAQARKTSAKIIELPHNRGKGAAMEVGVRHACYDTLLFLDADLTGLRPDLISMLLQEVLSGRHDMFTLIRDRKSEDWQMHLSSAYVVGGERALRRSVWDLVPAEDRRGYGIEMALNYYAWKHGLKAGHALAPGLKQIIKEAKRGAVRGFIMRVAMFAQVMRTVCKLHVLHREGEGKIAGATAH